MGLYMSYRKPYTVSRTVTTSFYLLPTVKKVRVNPDKKIIYDVAHHMFRDHPLHTPLLIYKYQSQQLSYDFYIERTEDGWNDTVFTHPVKSKDDKVVYIIDGLSYSITEEKEIQPLLLHMAEQIDIMCRLLEL